MYYDPELPDGFQDADFEARALEALGNREYKLKQTGKCSHSWFQGPPADVVKCLDCEKVFPSLDALFIERDNILSL